MAVLIREADLETELPLMLGLLNANRERRQTTLERFRWLYLDNLDGRAKVWLAVDDRTDSTVGFTGVFPRRIHVRGHSEPVVAWNCGDFSIQRSHRTMGVAVKLRRAAKHDVDRGERPFLYAHPNERMLAVHVRAGHRQMGRMQRFVKLLRVGSNDLARAGSGLALRAVGLDPFVRIRQDVQWISNGPWPADIGAIDAAVAPRFGAMLVRDHAYLDWRFRRYPQQAAELVVTRDAGLPTGYLAFTQGEDWASVRDWLVRDGSTFDQILVAFIREMRRRGRSRVSVTALSTHPDLPRLRRLGFFERETPSSAVVTYTPPGSGFEVVLDPASWYMTVGDRDV